MSRFTGTYAPDGKARRLSAEQFHKAMHKEGFRPDGKGGLMRPDNWHTLAGKAEAPIASPDWSRDGLSITLPHPPQALRPNARCHWGPKAKAVRAYRALAAMEARLVCAGNPPRWARATLEIVWSTRGSQHPDPDGVVASCKSAIDGLQDAGVVKNDRGLFPERPVILTGQAWSGVRLTVRGDTAKTCQENISDTGKLRHNLSNSAKSEK